MTYIRHKSDIERGDMGGSALEDTLSKASSLMVFDKFSRELKNALGHRKERP